MTDERDRLERPPGSMHDGLATVDCHAHVFRRGLPLDERRRYAPDYDAPLDRYAATLDANGIGRAVLVQPSFLGTDNSFLVDSIATMPQRLRGIAVVDPGIGDDRLAALLDAGIVGVRLNLIGAEVPDLKTPGWQHLLRRLATHALHVELHCEAGRLEALIEPLLESGIDVVVDHFGRPDPARGVDDPGFRSLLRSAVSDRVWVKLSAPYRVDAADRPSIVPRAAPMLLEAFGARRLLWGSDWPHTQYESTASYADALRSLSAWVPDERHRAIVLTETPARLYRFGPEARSMRDPAVDVATQDGR